MSEGELTKEAFLVMAEAVGLDVTDEAHMEELYTYTAAQLSSLRSINEIDVSEREPAMVFTPPSPGPTLSP